MDGPTTGGTVGGALARIRDSLLGEHRWIFATILLVGIGLNLFTIWSVRWLPLMDLGGWIELVDVVARYDDPATLYAEHFDLPSEPEPNTLALFVGWLIGPITGAHAAVKLLLSFYLVGLPLSLLAVCASFGRSRWLALFSVPMSFNALFMMGFVNFLVAMPFLFLAIALSRNTALGARWTHGALLAACLVVLYFSHVWALIITWTVCLAIILLSSEPRRYHLTLWPLLPVVPLFSWWFWRMFVALEATEAGRTFGDAADGAFFWFPGLETHFSVIDDWGMQLFHGGSEEVFVLVLILTWFWLIAMGQKIPGSGSAMKGVGALVRHHVLELVTVCCIVAYFCLPFDGNNVWVIAQRTVIISALLLSVWPRVTFDRWSRRAVLVPLVAVVVAFPFLVQARFRTFERDVIGDLPQAIDELPDRSKLAYHRGDGLNPVVQKPVLWQIPQAIHAPANGGITDRSWALFPYSAIQYKEGKTPETLPWKFWQSEHLNDYDYVLMLSHHKPRKVLKQASKLRLIFNQGSWWLFDVLSADDLDAREKWLVSKGMVCNGRSELCGANIVLVVLDSVRYDHLGHNGYQRNTSPVLDRLAEESVVFDGAYSHAPWTHPSIASIMTGMHPVDHGVAQWSHRLKKRRYTLAEALRSKGYHTQAHVGHLLFKPSSGYRQGFNVYDTSVLELGDPHQISSSKEISDTAILALSTMPEPFFLWLQYFDPHSEYVNHRAFDFPGDRPFDRYDSEIAYMDFHLGRVIEELERTGLIDRSIVVVVSDHGEEFWDHGGRFHEGKLYEELIHVPLIVRVPGVEHQRVQETVVLSDVAPTLLELIGIRTPAEFKGAPITFGPDGVKIEDRIVLAEVRRKGNKRAIIEDGYKLVFDYDGGNVELYDLRVDPKEKSNLSAQKKEKVSKLLTKLLEHEQKASKDPGVFVLDRDLAEKLRSLGYLE